MVPSRELGESYVWRQNNIFARKPFNTEKASHSHHMNHLYLRMEKLCSPGVNKSDGTGPGDGRKLAVVPLKD